MKSNWQLSRPDDQSTLLPILLCVFLLPIAYFFVCFVCFVVHYLVEIGE